MSLKERYKQKQEKQTLQKNIGDTYKEYLQSYLAWLHLQNPNFYNYLSNEEITNYFIHEIQLPNTVINYIQSSNPLDILSKTYEYLSRYKDKTSIFTISQKILPKKQGPYRSEDSL